MYIALCLVVLVQYVAAGPWFEMSQARHINADLDLGRDTEHLFNDFKVAHSKLGFQTFKASYCYINEPPHQKTNNLHMRKQRRSSALQ